MLPGNWLEIEALMAHEREIARVRRMNAELVTALTTLVEQLDAAMPSLTAAVVMAAAQGVDYTGPRIDVAAARAVLAKVKA